MAQREKVIIRCMDCEKDGLYEMWNDINSKTNQEQKKQLLSGHLSQYICPHCHSTRFVDHPMLYYSPDHELMIQCVMMDHDEHLALETFQAIQDGTFGQKYELGETYQYRVVRSLTQLREKALIFEHDLNDKIIELMKLHIFTQIQNADPDIFIEEIQADFPASGQIRFLVKIPENSGCSGKIISQIRWSVNRRKVHKKRRAEGLLEPSARNMKKRIYMEKLLFAFLDSYSIVSLCPLCGENLKIL